MKIYYSGWYAGHDFKVLGKLIDTGACKLCSYAYPKNAYDYLNEADKRGVSVDMMIDSGAFTAWSIGTEVHLDELMAYCKDLILRYGDRHKFEFVALDIIPGTKQRRATESEIQKGVDKSKDNYHILQQELGNGYEVLPVFHSGEPVELRDYYLSHTNHICFSMNLKMGESERVEWASRNQVEGVKLHGLAATGVQMIKYVNWYSVDSTYWLMCSSMGSIFWPHGNGKIATIVISDRSPSRKGKNTHAFTLTMKDEVENMIKAKGYTLKGLSEDHAERMLWNIDVWANNVWDKQPMKQEVLFND